MKWAGIYIGVLRSLPSSSEYYDILKLKSYQGRPPFTNPGNEFCYVGQQAVVCHMYGGPDVTTQPCQQNDNDVRVCAVKTELRYLNNTYMCLQIMNDNEKCNRDQKKILYKSLQFISFQRRACLHVGVSVYIAHIADQNLYYLVWFYAVCKAIDVKFKRCLKERKKEGRKNGRKGGKKRNKKDRWNSGKNALNMHVTLTLTFQGHPTIPFYGILYQHMVKRC